jgi:hypothetical protein
MTGTIMTTKQHAPNLREPEAAIYNVALSLDAFLLNGVQIGVLQEPAFPAFLQQAAKILLRDLGHLEEQSAHTSEDTATSVIELEGNLRAKCQQLIELVTHVSQFRNLSLEQVRAAVSQIIPLRMDCVELIQELEGCFQTSNPFYQSRPAHSALAVDEFLANLDHKFTEQWSAKN